LDQLTDTLPAFYEPKSAGDRPWGSEDLLCMVPGVATCKLLEVDEGHKGRLQRHHLKDEAGYVLSGRMIVRWVQGSELMERVLEPGESYHFPPGCIHQEEAVTSCRVIEISTPHGNDREGMEALFGFEVPEDALPSTRPEDVTVWEPWW
jgi:mannose-6-phosphate isomerase